MFTKSQFEELWNEILEEEEWKQYKDQEDKVRMFLGLFAWKCQKSSIFWEMVQWEERIKGHKLN